MRPATHLTHSFQVRILGLIAASLLSTSCSQPSSVKTASQSTSFTIGILEHSSSAPFVIAAVTKKFSEARVNVTLKTLPPTDHLPALMRGEVQMLSPSSFPAILSAANQYPGRFRCFLTGGEENGGEPIYGLLVRADSSFRTFRDLRGAHVGSSSPFTTLNLRLVSSVVLGSPEAVAITQVQDRALLRQGVIDRKFDAVVLDQPSLGLALSSSELRLLEPNFRAAYLRDPYWSGAALVDSKWLAAHGQTFEAVTKALDAALHEISLRPKEAKDIFSTYFASTPLNPSSLGFYHYPAAAFKPPRDFFSGLTTNLIAAKLLQAPVPYDELFL